MNRLKAGAARAVITPTAGRCWQWKEVHDGLL